MANKSEPVFKSYQMDQLIMFPPDIGETIPEKHLVRVVNRFVERLDLSSIIRRYPGGGSSSYHPRMMLKVLLYAYADKVYSSRRIAKSVRENLNYIWIAGWNKPDFRTINRFRLSIKDEIGEIFYSMVEMLFGDGYIKLENYFLDGTKIEANANKYSFVWKKSVKKNKAKLIANVEELLKRIDEENERENEAYGDKDLEEMGEEAGIDSEKLKAKAKELNEKLKNKPNDKETKKALKKIEGDYLPRLTKYEEQEELLGERNSYSKTDTDAVFMRMKEDHMRNGQLKPGYNVQIGTENQFIVGFSVHQRPGDTGTFIPHMEEIKNGLPKMPENIIADAGYGSEENYDYVDRHDFGNYIKYNNFRIEDTKKFKEDLFRTENLTYDIESDAYGCPNGKELKYTHTKSFKTENGYLTERLIYECGDCNGCLLREQCHKGKANRTIQVSHRLNYYRRIAKENLKSEIGWELRRLRGVEPESVFGDIKWNAGFRRFLLRGLKNTILEWGLVSIGHNLRKMSLRLSKSFFCFVNSISDMLRLKFLPSFA